MGHRAQERAYRPKEAWGSHPPPRHQLYAGAAMNQRYKEAPSRRRPRRLLRTSGPSRRVLIRKAHSSEPCYRLLDGRQRPQIGDQRGHVVVGDVLVCGKRHRWEELVTVAGNAGADCALDFGVAPLAEPAGFVRGQIGRDRDAPGPIKRLAAGSQLWRLTRAALGMTVHAAGERPG